MKRPGRGSILVQFYLALALLVPGLANAQVEAPPVLKARDLAPAELLAGQDFTVDATVPTDGFYGIFTVRGEGGSIQARGVAMLRVRVAETQALARLEETSRPEALVGGARDSAQQSVQGAEHLVQNPVGTVEAVPGSVGKLFSGLGKKVEKTVGKVTGSEESSAAPEEREGIAKERRALAQQLGVDPYTDNPLLSAKLDQVAKWKRHGQLALSVVTGGASLYAGVALKTASLVCSQPPEEVSATNQKRLAALTPAPSAEDIRAFLDNPAFTPTTQSLLVAELEALPVPKGRDSLVKLAGQMASHDQARFLVMATDLLAAYHERVTPLASVDARGLLAVGLTPSGELVVSAPVDCLAWTDKLSEFGQRSDLHAAKREILLSGFVTSRTRQELSARGWTLREGFQGISAKPDAAK
jgi:hypothetical protein